MIFKMSNNRTLAVIAIVAALGLLGGVRVLVANNLAIQEAEAGCEKGFPRSAPSINASQGRCFRGQ
jgi:hypothetical protein